MIENAVVWEFRKYCIDFPCETLLLLLKSFASTSVLGCADSRNCRRSAIGTTDFALPISRPLLEYIYMPSSTRVVGCTLYHHYTGQKFLSMSRCLVDLSQRDHRHAKIWRVRRKHIVRTARADARTAYTMLVAQRSMESPCIGLDYLSAALTNTRSYLEISYTPTSASVLNLQNTS